MARAGDTVADPVSGATIVFRATAAETGGTLLQMEVTAAARWSAGPVHVHPKQEERIEVVRGTLRSRVGAEGASHRPGDVVAFPPGTPHTIWNGGDDDLCLLVEFRPTLRMEGLFETAFGLGRTRATRTPLRELVRLLFVTRGYRDEIRLARPRLLHKRRLTTALGRFVVNPIVKFAFALHVIPRGYLLLETTGRRSGRQRRTPVGYARDGDTLWIVSEHGRRAGYVRNVEADPRVRVKLEGRWRRGRARTVPDDDAAARLRQVGTVLTRLTVRALQTELLTLRVDLDE